MAGEYPSWSPYNYVLGNPIRLIDPDGKAPTFTGPGDKLTGAQVRSHFQSDASPTSYSISIYANQPKPGTNEILDGTQFGHAFVGITVTYDDNTTKSLYTGLYATDEANVNPAYDRYRGDGVLMDDSGAKATAGLSKNIDADGFNNVIDIIASSADGATYDVNSNNCTDFAVAAYNAAGGSQVSTPSRAIKGTHIGLGDYDFGTAKMPGQLGQDLKNAGGTATTEKFVPGGEDSSTSKSYKDYFKY